MIEIVELFCKLVIGHAIADFWAQTDEIDTMKNRHNDPAKFYCKGQRVHALWPYALSAHAVIHGAAVWWITGSFGLFIAETVAHWIIDFGKCENWFGLHTDQALHILCKLVWCAVVFYTTHSF